jgi:hypothetical protein
MQIYILKVILDPRTMWLLLVEPLKSIKSLAYLCSCQCPDLFFGSFSVRVYAATPVAFTDAFRGIPQSLQQVPGENLTLPHSSHFPSSY